MSGQQDTTHATDAAKLERRLIRIARGHLGCIIAGAHGADAAVAARGPAQTQFSRAAAQSATILLLPQSPLGSLQYARVQPALAAEGYASIALDLMGYGASDPRREHWSIEDFAQAVLEAMDVLALWNAVVIAGHFGAQIAIELAALAPERVTRLVLDGTPLYSSAIRDRLRAPQPPPAPSDDGAHAAEMWRRTLAFLATWDPSLAAAHAQSNADVVRALYVNFLRANYEPPVTIAIGAHETAARLAQLRQPVLALTADTDSLAPCHESVLTTAPDARGHRFAGRHPLQALDGGDAARWLEPVLAFLRPPGAG